MSVKIKPYGVTAYKDGQPVTSGMLALTGGGGGEQEVFTAIITKEVGCLVCDMTAREIIDADRKGIVKARYTDDATGETRIYQYAKQMQDGRAAFGKDGYIEDGVTKQVIIYVDYAGNVTKEIREPTVDAELSETSEFPVQNKVVAAAVSQLNESLADKVAISDLTPATSDMTQQVGYNAETKKLVTKPGGGGVTPNKWAFGRLDIPESVASVNIPLPTSAKEVWFSCDMFGTTEATGTSNANFVVSPSDTIHKGTGINGVRTKQTDGRIWNFSKIHAVTDGEMLELAEMSQSGFAPDTTVFDEIPYKVGTIITNLANYPEINSIGIEVYSGALIGAGSTVFYAWR